MKNARMKPILSYLRRCREERIDRGTIAMAISEIRCVPVRSAWAVRSRVTGQCGLVLDFLV